MYTDVRLASITVQISLTIFHHSFSVPPGANIFFTKQNLLIIDNLKYIITLYYIIIAHFNSITRHSKRTLQLSYIYNCQSLQLVQQKHQFGLKAASDNFKKLKFEGSHFGDNEDYLLLGCDVEQSGKSVCRHFLQQYINSQDRGVSLALKLRPFSTQMAANVYHTTRHYIPEGSNLGI